MTERTPQDKRTQANRLAPVRRTQKTKCPPAGFVEAQREKANTMTQIDAEAVAILDDPQAPAIASDNYTGLQIINAQMQITLDRAQVDFSGTGTDGAHPVYRIVNGRLSLPLAVARRMAQHILEYADQWQTEETNRLRGVIADELLPTKADALLTVLTNGKTEH